MNPPREIAAARISARSSGLTTTEILEHWAKGQMWCNIGRHWYYRKSKETRPCADCRKKRDRERKKGVL